MKYSVTPPLVDRIRQVTQAEMAPAVPAVPPPKPTREQEMANLIQHHFAVSEEQRKTLGRLFALVIGQDLPPASAPLALPPPRQFPSFTMVRTYDDPGLYYLLLGGTAKVKLSRFPAVEMPIIPCPSITSGEYVADFDDRLCRAGDVLVDHHGGGNTRRYLKMLVEVGFLVPWENIPDKEEEEELPV